MFIKVAKALFIITVSFTMHFLLMLMIGYLVCKFPLHFTFTVDLIFILLYVGLLSVSGQCCLVELPDFLYPCLSCLGFQKNRYSDVEQVIPILFRSEYLLWPHFEVNCEF